VADEEANVMGLAQLIPTADCLAPKSVQPLDTQTADCLAPKSVQPLDTQTADCLAPKSSITEGNDQ
jgi:hypothetical protein